MKQLLFGLLFTITFAGNAQYDSAYTEKTPEPQDRLNLKLDVTNFVDPLFPAFLLSVEYFVRPDFSINHEAGVIHRLEEAATDPSFEGYKMRHSARWFIDEGDGGSIRFYTSVSFHYRYLAVVDRYTLGYECEQFGNCEYLRNFVGKVKTDQYGLQSRLGLQTHLSNRLIFEADLGLGYQYYDLRRSTINGGRFMEPDRVFDEDDFGWKPFITISWKLGFVLIQNSKL